MLTCTTGPVAPSGLCTVTRNCWRWISWLLAMAAPISGSSDAKRVAQMSGGGGMPVPAVMETYTSAGTDKFGKFTIAHVHELNGLVLDDKILSAPNINEPILDGRAEITGFKDLKEAQALADLLNAGALPVPMRQVQTQQVDATLGPGAMEKMVHAGLIGFACVVVFMLLMYRLPGLVASLALVIYSLYAMAIYRVME